MKLIDIAAAVSFLLFVFGLAFSVKDAIVCLIVCYVLYRIKKRIERGRQNEPSYN